MYVQSSVFRQKRDGERLLAHLYNNINTSGGAAFPNDDVPLREEVIPIHGIHIRFDEKLGVKRLHLEPGGLELQSSLQGGVETLALPPLGMHCMVVAELE